MYHFIGIKGSGMSALAQIMKELGYSVQGSDVPKYFLQRMDFVNLEFLFYHLTLITLKMVWK